MHARIRPLPLENRRGDAIFILTLIQLAGARKIVEKRKEREREKERRNYSKLALQLFMPVAHFQMLRTGRKKADLTRPSI